MTLITLVEGRGLLIGSTPMVAQVPTPVGRRGMPIGSTPIKVRIPPVGRRETPMGNYKVSSVYQKVFSDI
jgi:hypothetical protein